MDDELKPISSNCGLFSNCYNYLSERTSLFLKRSWLRMWHKQLHGTIEDELDSVSLAVLDFIVQGENNYANSDDESAYGENVTYYQHDESESLEYRRY